MTHANAAAQKNLVMSRKQLWHNVQHSSMKSNKEKHCHPTLAQSTNAAAWKVMPWHGKMAKGQWHWQCQATTTHVDSHMLQDAKQFVCGSGAIPQEKQTTQSMWWWCAAMVVQLTATPDIALLLLHGIATTAALPPMPQVDCCFF